MIQLYNDLMIQSKVDNPTNLINLWLFYNYPQITQIFIIRAFAAINSKLRIRKHFHRFLICDNIIIDYLCMLNLKRKRYGVL